MEDDKFIPDLDMNVPVAYAAFEVVMDEEKKKAIDAIYVYANKAYCEMVGKDKSELLGHSFLSVYDNADEKWFDYCYEAAQGKGYGTACTAGKWATGWNLKWSRQGKAGRPSSS